MKFKKFRKMALVTFLSSNMVAASMPMPAMAAAAGDPETEKDLAQADGFAEAEEEEGLPYYAEFFGEDDAEENSEEDAEAKKAEAKRLYEERQKEEAQMRIEEQLRKEQAHREEGGKSASYVSKKTQEKTVSQRGGSIYDDYPHVMASDSTDTTQRDRYVAYSVSGNDVEIAIDVSDVADMDIFNYGSSNYAFEVYFTDGMKDYYVSAFAATEDVGILNLEQLQGHIMVRTGEYSASGTSCDISVDGGFLVFKGTISEWMTETFDAQNFAVTGYHCNEWIAYSMEHSYMTWSLDDNGKLTIRDAEARTDGMSFIPLYEQCGQVKSIDMDVKNAYGWERLFAGFPNLETATVKADALSSLSYMFLRCPKLKTVTLRIGDVSQVFSLQAMFKDCKSLTNVDLGTLNTSGAQYFNDMFRGCGSLKTLDLSGLDTSAATEMYDMLAASEMVWDDDLAEYSYHSNLKSIRFGRAFDTSNVRTMSWMFEGCNALESLDLSGFDTSNLERVNSMFHNCKSLQEIDLSNFDLSQVSDDWSASGMFYNTESLRRIKSPKNLGVSADLPWQKNWCRMDTREQIYELPRNEGSSVEIAAMLETPIITYIGYGENRLFINWWPSDGCSKYRILRRTSNTQNWVTIAEVGDGIYTYVDERVVNGTEYEYAIVGISEDGSEELTCWSESVSVTPSLDLKAPELIRTVSYYDGIKLYWDCNMGVEKYRVLRKTKGGNWKTLAEVEASSYKDLTAVAGKKYYYTVVGISRVDGRVLTAYNEAGLEAHLRLNQPEYTPLTDANGNVYDLGGMEIIVRDWWSEDGEWEAETDYEVERESYLDWAQKTYNFKIKQIYISDWGSAPQDFVDYASQPADDQNYVFTLREDPLVVSAMHSGLCYDLATLDCLDFSQQKFQRNLTHTKYSFGQKIYATYGGSGWNEPDGYAEPRTGVFFNKQLLRDAGIDPESIYDMQMNGTWTWDALVDLLGKVQRDVDGDGTIDIYGANCNKGLFTEACVYSNGGEFIGKLDSGEYEVRIEDQKSMEGLQFAQDVFDTYFEKEPDDASWDYYKTSFTDGNYAFLFDQAYVGQAGMGLDVWYDEYGVPHDTGMDWGFVMFPKGPKADDYVNCWSNNIVCIPANYDADRAWKIAFAWNLYTNETPGLEENDNWKSFYSQTFDQRAVNETLAMMRTKGMVSMVDMIPSIQFGPELTWNIYPGTGSQLWEIVENAAEIWQGCVEAENARLGFAATVDKSAPELLGAEVEYGDAAAGVRVTWKPNKGVSNYAIFRKKEGGSWRKIGTAETVRNRTGSYLDATAVVGTTYAYSVRGMDADGNYITAFDQQGLTVTMSEPYTELAITKQPVDWYGTIGKKASFTVEAVGDGLSYQWQYKKGSKWIDYGVTSATTANFKVSINEKNILYPIRCVITDSRGNSVTTDEVWIKDASVASPITITKQPVDWEGEIGKKATFSVEASGSGLTYQWQYKKGTKWMPYTVTSATTAILKVTMNDVNVQYPVRCLITDESGNTTTTNEVWMRVKEEPVIEGITITSQPTDWTGTYGQKASFNVTATGDGLTYQWQYKKGTTWTDYAIATADTPNFKVTMNEKNVKWAFRCKITDSKGNVEYTNEVYMRLKSEDPIPEGITITSQPCDWYGRYGQKASFNVTATGEGLTYQWQYKKGTGDWTNYEIATANTANFQVTMNEKNVKWTYRCVITDTKGNVETTNEVHMYLSE